MIQQTNKDTLLGKIAAVIEMGGESGLSPEFFAQAVGGLNAIAQEMGVTAVQAALFAFVFDLSVFSNDLQEKDLIKVLKCSKTDYLEYLNDLDELAEAGFLNKKLDRWDGTTYSVPRNIVLSLRKHKPLQPRKLSGLTLKEFLCEVQEAFRCRYNDEMSYGELDRRLSVLITGNAELPLVEKLNGFGYGTYSRNLLLYFCNKAVSSDPSTFSPAGVVNLEAVRKNFKDDDGFLDDIQRLLDSLEDGSHPLLKDGLVANYCNNGLASPDEFVLTRWAERELLGDLKGMKAFPGGAIVKAADIKEKKMFYNRKDAEELDTLAQLLMPARFEEIKNKLASRGMRGGFACLFSGAPGTGKTETAYQLARETGRDLIRVDISAIKNCWVGETEKNIKAIFDDYRDAVKDSTLEPILFFNEADAVIGKRIMFSGGDHAVDRMENTMQNIILQEMENLEGILIATTNLTENMDEAFERRFLYKIDFKKPEGEVRRNLWLSMIPELRQEDAYRLADRFNFSGGQIENIARKREVEFIIRGREPSFDSLVLCCENELSAKNRESRVGFCS